MIAHRNTSQYTRFHGLSSTLVGTFCSKMAESYLIPKRYVLSGMIFLGFLNMFALRVNINVAIGAMAKNHTIFVNGKKVLEEAEFNWSSRLQGFILGSFYYGYIALQIVGGGLAIKLGAIRLFGFSLFSASLLTLVTPIATRTSVNLLIVIRILEGLVLGVMFPCNHAIWSKWAPSSERATLLTISITGCTIGSVAAMPITGLLTMLGHDGGWPFVFYCFGIPGILWYLFWLLLAYETPNDHPTISIKEKDYIEKTAVTAYEMKADIPWKKLLSSHRVWAITAAAFAGDWGLYILLICMPVYLLDVIQYDVQDMGFVAAVPFLFKTFSCPFGGFLSDLLLSRGYLNILNARRTFFSLGASTGIFLLLAGYTKDAVLVVVCIAMAGFASGLTYAGFHVNMLDIAPRNASIIMGLCNTVGGTTGFITPMMVGFLTRGKTAGEWKMVFWITETIYLCCTSLFCVFITDKRQEWDKPSEEVNTPLPISTVELNQEDALENMKEDNRTVEKHEKESTENGDK